MVIKHRKNSDLRENQVTPEDHYLNRRHFMAGSGALAAGAAAAAILASEQSGARELKTLPYKEDPSPLGEDLTPYEAVTNYNNFYEFGLDKSDPARYADSMVTHPWKVTVDGLTNKPGLYEFDDLIPQNALEERIYRLRCVEAWSMVVPWIGIPLKDIIARLEPASNARYVRFETLADRTMMRGLRGWPVLDWPYREALRMDEALHPLTLMATGLYGKEIPNQNGAPMRLIIPWKYGFKSIKSIVRISFLKDQPKTSWELSAPSEYGFYANVNPLVDHPRWSQARERRIGEFGRRETLMFNGYAEEVGDLYAGLDLARNF